MSDAMRRAVNLTSGPCKGGVNPPNDSDWRPPAPGGSGGIEWCGTSRKYRKLPVVIEAVQFTGHNLAECLVFTGVSQESADGCQAMNMPLIIGTLEGEMTATPGDWIIKGVKGEFYPCKPDVFNATYEAVE